MSKFKHRQIVPEIIDDFEMKGTAMEENLEEIEWINKNLGGTKTSALPILSYIQKHQTEKLKVVDVGCGSGDILKYIQTNVGKHISVELTGVDANEHIIEFALKKHFLQDKVSFIHADIIQQPEQIPTAEVYMLNLFLHHFEMEDIEKILQNLFAKQPSVIVINDLERSKISYLLFRLLCYFNNASYITINDGKLSILKGFNRSEMKKIGSITTNYTYQLKWRWAFRWQMILTRN